ncbi:hypothetical protein FHS72_002512 [Loktanella ponticola]|uniref:Uncharacterized protein n=1 Tax=Yoonia ponticola TaxID=1524255 RepID=A0A7W9BM53_9RHOB|nr:DEAD/DEAH box helicase family protein [Yoonia ponticola]MBB5722882.1 hypothetical protein [Yoonia ponticola]
MTKVTVIDTIMGAGKTSYIINFMNKTGVQETFDAPERRFIYVTPLLSEVERVQTACPDLRFKDPKPIHGRKFYGLQRLIEDGQNIATTHELFRMLTPEVCKLINDANYTLVIDEVLTCCDHFKELTAHDQRDLFGSGKLYVENDGSGRLRWNHKDHGNYVGKFSSVKHLCDNGNLAVYADRRGKRGVLLWQFPTEFLGCFDEVFVLTYLYHGSAMSSYLEAKGVPVSLMAVSGDREQGYSLTRWDEHSEALKKAEIRNLITIYEGPGNRIGTPNGREQPLSSSWFKRQSSKTLAKLRGSTVTFFKNHAKTCAGENAWTTFKDHRAKLKGAGYAGKSCWISLNTKSTNDYAHKRSMAYLANIFCLPVLRNYFAANGVVMNDDAFAISEMVQVIWRTAIRNGEPIMLYIPSERMRNLFKLWLECDSTAELMQRLQPETKVLAA